MKRSMASHSNAISSFPAAYRCFLQGFLLGLFLLTLAACGSEGDTMVDPAKPSQSTDPKVLIESAIKKQEVGAYQSAIEELNRALQVDPKSVPAQFQIGEIYKEWGKRPEAMTAYKKVLALKPDHIQAHLGLAWIYDKMSYNDQALLELLKVAKITPDDPEIHFKIALEHWYMQDLEACVDSYRKVIELSPRHLQAHLNLASVYEKQKNWDRSLSEIGRSIQIGEETGETQAVNIAKNKLKFLKGRMNISEEEFQRKSQPPFN